MYISRIYIKNFRSFGESDVALQPGVTCIIGENNTGKSNLLHAIRLPLDANLSSQFRQLTEQDIHSATDITRPFQVIVAVEFSDFADKVDELALVGTWQVSEGLARLCYRFRPKRMQREAIESGENDGSGLDLENDYGWEITGGGANSPERVEWNEALGSSVHFTSLQNFKVEFLPPLRDVGQALRQVRVSPLARLISTSGITEVEKRNLVEIIRDANARVVEQPTITNTGLAMQGSFTRTAGEAFEMRVRLGMADPSFASISRALTILLTDESLEDFEPQRNGLGINNILFISMLIEYFDRRIASQKSPGQLLLIEEPEAHLHPQLQRALYSALKGKGVQTLLTTHSTHISSQAKLSTLVTLTKTGSPAIAASVPAIEAGFTDGEIADLERYLDATRSTLLFARKVLLVEGPAEAFLIPPILKQVLEIDLDRMGIAIVPIYGVHFPVYAKLFSRGGLAKKCAILADGDLKPSDASTDATGEPTDARSRLPVAMGEHVRTFYCKTTFERAMTMRGTLIAMEHACSDCGYSECQRKLRDGRATLDDSRLSRIDRVREMRKLKDTVLRAAKRMGKARFAQIASKYVGLCTDIPPYIRNAIKWLSE